MIGRKSRNKILNKLKKFDYSRKKLENPFFRRKEKINKTNGLKIKIISTLIILLICVIFWGLYFSTFLKITEISIAGAGRVSNEVIYEFAEEQVRAKKFFILPQKNLFLFDRKKFSELLLQKYRFENVSVAKKWPHKLEITIKEKPFVCVWNEKDKYYYADIDGFILEEINSWDVKKKKIPLIRNESEQKISNYEIQVDKEYLKYAQELFEKISDKSFGINTEKFIIDEDADTIKIKTEEGIKISFSTKRNFNEQIEKLLVVKREKLKDDFNNKEYIDLRFGDKVYYK